MEKFGITKEYYNPIKNFSFVSPNNEIQIKGSQYSACVLDVRKTYQYLALQAFKQGVEIFVKSNVYDIKKDKSTGIIILKSFTPYGTIEVEANLVIDASGFNSFVSRKLGFVSNWIRYGVGAEYECYCDKIDSETLCLMVGKKYSEAGYAWAFPLSSNRVRIGVGIGRPESQVDPLSKLNEIINKKLNPLHKYGKIQPIEFHYGMIPNEGLRQKSVFENVILVGDTAGHANPLVLEGIRYAIEFGMLAGKIGSNYIKNKSDMESLNEYDLECKRILYKRINSALKVQSRWLNLSDEEWNKEINIIKDLSIEEFLDFIKSDFTYSKMIKVALNHPKLAVRQLFNLVANKLS